MQKDSDPTNYAPGCDKFQADRAFNRGLIVAGCFAACLPIALVGVVAAWL